MFLVDGHVAGDTGNGYGITQIQCPHPQGGRTDWFTVGLQNPNLSAPVGVVDEVPVELLLKMSGIGKIPKPQVNDDLPVLLEIRGNYRVLRHLQRPQIAVYGGLWRRDGTCRAKTELCNGCSSCSVRWRDA